MKVTGPKGRFVQELGMNEHFYTRIVDNPAAETYHQRQATRVVKTVPRSGPRTEASLYMPTFGMSHGI